MSLLVVLAIVGVLWGAAKLLHLRLETRVSRIAGMAAGLALGVIVPTVVEGYSLDFVLVVLLLALPGLIIAAPFIVVEHWALQSLWQGVRRHREESPRRVPIPPLSKHQ
jgi:hypothetical protein